MNKLPIIKIVVTHHMFGEISANAEFSSEEEREEAIKEWCGDFTLSDEDKKLLMERYNLTAKQLSNKQDILDLVYYYFNDYNGEFEIVEPQAITRINAEEETLYFIELEWNQGYEIYVPASHNIPTARFCIMPNEGILSPSEGDKEIEEKYQKGYWFKVMMVK